MQKFLNSTRQYAGVRTGKVLLSLVLLLGLAGLGYGVQGQEPAASPAPLASPSPSTNELKQLQVPDVAPDYRGQQKPLPDLKRVGVDMGQQHPLALRDALAMALDNNKDIEVARENVKIAEFDLLGAHGAYDPRINTTAFYERIETPISSF